MVPFPSLDSSGAKELPESSCQETTLTKSATNEGIEHLRIAALPRITYSLFTSDSYCCCTTKIFIYILIQKVQGIIHFIGMIIGRKDLGIYTRAKRLTIVFAREEIFVFTGVPRENLNEISNE